MRVNHARALCHLSMGRTMQNVHKAATDTPEGVLNLNI